MSAALSPVSLSVRVIASNESSAFGMGDRSTVAIGAAAAVPEPSTYAAIAGVLVLVGTILVRRRGYFKGL